MDKNTMLRYMRNIQVRFENSTNFYDKFDCLESAVDLALEAAECDPIELERIIYSLIDWIDGHACDLEDEAESIDEKSMLYEIDNRKDEIYELLP